MKFVFASYVVTKEFNQPEAWLNRIRAYAGIMESLSVSHEVISIEQIDYEGEYVKNGVNYKFVKLSAAGHYFPGKLHRQIRDMNPDIVVIHGLHYPLQVIQLRLKLGKKIKIMVQNHAEQPFHGIKRYLQRWADPYVNAYLFASREMGLDWVTKGNLVSPQKIHEVMEISSVFYPVDKELAKSKTKANGQPVFLWVGRLNKNKDPLTVIRAFLKFTITYPGARLYMIYHTEELLAELKEWLEKQLAKEAVIWIGKIPNDELLYWYNSADFILSGSYYEGAGTAVCEAMSCGCVPVVTDIFSFRMTTDGGKCGALYEAGNETALLSTLLQIQQSDLQEKRNRSLCYFKSNLSFEAIARDFEQIAGVS